MLPWDCLTGIWDGSMSLKYFQEGLKRDPHDAQCLFNIGYIEERQGNYARAEELFKQVLDSYPDTADALLELANLRTNDKKIRGSR